MHSRLVIDGSVYTADIRPKKPFIVDLLRDGADQHQAVWMGAQIIFDVNQYPELDVPTKKNNDGTHYAVIPWKESVYEALEKDLRAKLAARKA